MRGASGPGASRAEEKGASRLARAGVLEQYVEHGKQAQRSPGGRIVCFDRRVVRNAGQIATLFWVCPSRKAITFSTTPTLSSSTPSTVISAQWGVRITCSQANSG